MSSENISLIESFKNFKERNTITNERVREFLNSICDDLNNNNPKIRSVIYNNINEIFTANKSVNTSKFVLTSYHRDHVEESYLEGKKYDLPFEQPKLFAHLKNSDIIYADVILKEELQGARLCMYDYKNHISLCISLEEKQKPFYESLYENITSFFSTCGPLNIDH